MPTKKKKKPVKRKTTRKKKAAGSGLVKFASFIKRDRTVKSATKKVTELERKLAAEKKRKAAAKKAATKKYKRIHK